MLTLITALVIGLCCVLISGADSIRALYHKPPTGTGIASGLHLKEEEYAAEAAQREVLSCVLSGTDKHAQVSEAQLLRCFSNVTSASASQPCEATTHDSH